MEDEKVFLICAPVQSAQAVVPGSVQRDCTECGTKIWMAPSGQKLVSERPATIICLQCGLVMMEKERGPHEIEVTKEAAQEIRAWRRRN